MQEKQGRWSWVGSGEVPPGMIRFFTRLFIGLGVLAFVGLIMTLIDAFVFHRA